jgi:hypothetical protein
MSHFIPVYDVFLAPHEVSRFYATDDGSFCSVSNIEKPLIHIPDSIWNAATKGWDKGQYRDYKDVIAVPTWGAKKEDLDEHLPPNIVGCAQSAYGISEGRKFAVFVVQKELPHGLVEIGIFSPGNDRGYLSHYPHSKWENYINRYMGLKAFW